MAKIKIGTSGWNYRAWRGSFLPDSFPAKEWLTLYASQFNSVEVQLFLLSTAFRAGLHAWYQQTPDHFRSDASRYLTHIKGLKDVRQAWNTFVTRVSILRHKLGPRILQFPSSVAATGDNIRHLNDFLASATKRADCPRLAWEFHSQ